MEVRGVVRNIDDLGRVVIPKEFRRDHGIVVASPVEIISTDEGILIKPYDVKLSEKIRCMADELEGLGNTPADYEDARVLRDIARNYLKRSLNKRD